MNRHPYDNEGHPDRGMPMDRGIVPQPPIPQRGFTVSFREWHRIKQSVKDIRSTESQWLSAAYALLSAGIAFVIAAISLWQLGNADNWIFIAFCALAVAGLMSAMLCIFGFRGSRDGRQKDIDSVITYMDDIMANYTDESADRQPTP